MKAREILLGCARDGVSLSVTDDGLIRYSGNKYAVAYWLPILAENKASVIAAISRNGQPAVVRGCISCRHRTRPGLSGGYCAGRDDLPAAYGINHPLRKLPTDGGTTCSSWETDSFNEGQQ